MAGNTELARLATSAGLELPLRLFAQYRGQMAVASLEADGLIDYEGEKFHSPSTAGTAARMKLGYEGERTKPATNGWIFWSYRDPGGVERLIDHLRRPPADAPEAERDSV